MAMREREKARPSRGEKRKREKSVVVTRGNMKRVKHAVKHAFYVPKR